MAAASHACRAFTTCHGLASARSSCRRGQRRRARLQASAASPKTRVTPMGFRSSSWLVLAALACSSSQQENTIEPSLYSSAVSVDLGLRVDGRHLVDRCGERIVLRGVNEMIVWSPGRDGVPELGEIAKTGANAVRMVWTDEGSAGALDSAIANALGQRLIPIIEHHG